MGIGELALSFTEEGGTSGQVRLAQLPPRPHLNIYSVWGLLELMKEMALWNNTHRVSTTHDGCKISKSRFSEDPVMMVYRIPKTLNQTGDSLQWTFANKIDWTKVYIA